MDRIPNIKPYQTGSLPLVVAMPDDTLESYLHRLLLAYWGAGRRDEKLDDGELERAVTSTSAQVRKL